MRGAAQVHEAAGGEAAPWRENEGTSAAMRGGHAPEITYAPARWSHVCRAVRNARHFELMLAMLSHRDERMLQSGKHTCSQKDGSGELGGRLLAALWCAVAARAFLRRVCGCRGFVSQLSDTPVKRCTRHVDVASNKARCVQSAFCVTAAGIRDLLKSVRVLRESLSIRCRSGPPQRDDADHSRLPRPSGM